MGGDTRGRTRAPVNRRLPQRRGRADHGGAVTIRRDRDAHATAATGERRPREQSGPAADTGASPSAQDAATAAQQAAHPRAPGGAHATGPLLPARTPEDPPEKRTHPPGQGRPHPLGARAPRRDARGPTLTTHPRGEVWSAPMPGHLGCGGTRAGSALTRARSPRASDAGRRRRLPLHVNPTRAASGQRLQRLAGHVGGRSACAVAAPPPQLGGEGREICASPRALRLRQPAGRL